VHSPCIQCVVPFAPILEHDCCVTDNRGQYAYDYGGHWGDDGLAFGNPHQLYENAAGAFAAIAWSLGITAVIIKIMDAVWPGGIRVTPKEEEIGLDLAQHGERAYVTG